MSSTAARTRPRAPRSALQRTGGRGNVSRERLLEIGVTALRRGGYHGTGLTEILASARLPKGSFYHHFPSKEEFALEAVRHFGESVVARLDKELGRRADDPLRALESYFAALCRQYTREEFALGCLLGNLGQEIAASNRNVATVVKTYLDDLHERFADAIAQAQRLGSARDDLNAGTLAEWLADGWHGALIRMKVERSARPAQRFIRTFFRFLRDCERARRHATAAAKRPEHAA